ncbi:hypothetical protein K502DRAFT_365267 [Neoconidiobolus thromboides FSU 785]|nr:hypothetical protein K502DRAFT_365267 [Neoconidiobolus thromboides FSU 785]
METAKKVQALVVDAGAIIKNGIRFKDYADEFVTIQEVLNEIRDKESRSQLNLFPYEIKVRIPTPEAMKAVIAFSKKTGDFSTLSSVDLKVLALTYMLEKEIGDISKIRKEPIKAKVAVGGQVLGDKEVNIEDKGEIEQEDEVEEDKTQVRKKEDKEVTSEREGEEKKMEENNGEAKLDIITEKINDLSIDNEDAKLNDATFETTNEEQTKDEEEDEESDGEGWITPHNIKKKQIEFMGDLNEKEETRKVGCITTDFAMQNVLLQMDLGLISLEGLSVKEIKSFVLRCHACYHVTTNMEKRFCPKCGGNTLTRVTSSVDKDGNVRYYLKKNYQYNLRGTKYNIPTFKGGHKSQDLILAEDQKEYIRGMKNYSRRKEVNLFDPDYLPGIVSGKQSNTFLLPAIGYGRKNPNQAKRRSGRKKS